MDQRTVGTSTLVVSVAGLGCNNFGRPGRGLDQAGTTAVVHAALDAGVTLFDTARRYGDGQSEVLLGRALGSRRDEAVIATKFGLEDDDPDNGGSRGYIRKAVEISLSALDTDRIDLYQLHRPDPATPIAETIGALDELVDEGKILAYGWSNVKGWQVADAQWTATSAGQRGFATVQNEWSLLQRGIEADVVPACEHFGLGILPYFPIASGLLTGKVRRGTPPPPDSRLAAPRFADTFTDRRFDAVEAIERWGAERGRSLLEVALSWLASQPVVTSVIAGAMSPAQVTQNAGLTRTDLTVEEVGELRTLLDGI